MTCSIVSFWRQCDGPIHPADREVLANAPELFNLDYPPPAYIGDVENAPVILLNGNGGYKPTVTSREFPDRASEARATDRLHNPAPVLLTDVSPYYASANYARWLETGEVAMVNAIAYRAPAIVPEVRRIASKLPSTQTHIKWLRSEVIPAVMEGGRLIVAHRYGLWSFKRDDGPPGMYFSKNYRSKHVSSEALILIENFLMRRA